MNGQWLHCFTIAYCFTIAGPPRSGPPSLIRSLIYITILESGQLHFVIWNNFLFLKYSPSAIQQAMLLYTMIILSLLHEYRPTFDWRRSCRWKKWSKFYDKVVRTNKSVYRSRTGRPSRWLYLIDTPFFSFSNFSTFFNTNHQLTVRSQRDHVCDLGIFPFPEISYLKWDIWLTKSELDVAF